MFWMMLGLGLVATVAGLVTQLWFVAVLGGCLAMQTISEDRTRLVAEALKLELQQLKSSLRETSEKTPDTTVRLFWSRYRFEQDQKKPGGPFGPLAGVG